ncbi:Emopamil-binding protein [Pseudoneurospora amorphoporcata]|uniref:Emopamil-binding protein n=1 Tax=Pseudoneurospora amorphoporcata TaxID=241081 RepID=A0AAN6SFL5_9PEZI|nr:Emopamil-binding protein [Pseudoneurospora amorphoporcata]
MASTVAPSSLESFLSTLPPDLFDQTTLISLASTVAILVAAYSLSRAALDPKTTTSRSRFLFIWHAFDALIHFCLEGSFLYHCFFSSAPLGHLNPKEVFIDPYNYLGRIDRVHGAQAVAGKFVEGVVGGPAKAGALGGGFLEKIVKGTAELWMVYAKADKRWAGVDLSVVSLELLTVLVVGPMACWVCYDIAKRNSRVNIVMIMIATAEIYGGWMTFCPEWLVGSVNLDTSNWMYLWLYLAFFNGLWVVIPAYVIYVASGEIMSAFKVRDAAVKAKKSL